MALVDRMSVDGTAQLIVAYSIPGGLNIKPFRLRKLNYGYFSCY
jgi:hypothetical protein